MKVFRVVPNPYRMLDAEGKPIAVFPCHLRHAPGEYVGATKALDVLQPASYVNVKNKSGSVRQEVAQFDRSRAVFTFSTEPVEVPASGEIGAYYSKAIKAGALLPADKETARVCGVDFVPVEEALAKQREKAAVEFRRQTGNAPAMNEKPAPGAALSK